MTTETIEAGPLEYVQTQLKAMPGGQLPRLAVDVGVTLRTVYNIKNGKRDAKYSTVMALHKKLKEAEAAAGAQ